MVDVKKIKVGDTVIYHNDTPATVTGVSTGTQPKRPKRFPVAISTDRYPVLHPYTADGRHWAYENEDFDYHHIAEIIPKGIPAETYDKISLCVVVVSFVIALIAFVIQVYT